jgi:hypothetical protein
VNDFTPPPVRPGFYAYVVVDVSQEPAAPQAMKMSRKDARDYISSLETSENLRIRRARVTLYQS